MDFRLPRGGPAVEATGADDRAHRAGRGLSPRAARSHRRRPSRHRPRCGRALPGHHNTGCRRRLPTKREALGLGGHRADRRGAAVRGSMAVLTRIKGGRVIDPANGRDDISDVWFRDGRIIAAPPDGTRADDSYDATGKIVMAGAIDIHSHIAGSNVNTARLLLPELHRDTSAARPQTPLSNALWGTFETGCRYAAMGFTTVVEPAVAPDYALHAHLELADIPII